MLVRFVLRKIENIGVNINYLNLNAIFHLKWVYATLPVLNKSEEILCLYNFQRLC